MITARAYRAILPVLCRGPEKAQGLVNGGVGTVEAIDGQRMVIALDGRARSVALVVGTNAEAGEFGGIRHGYAGTIYKGQGKTLDQTYLLHSKYWRESSSYVALSRHRDEARVFVESVTARNLDQLARQMSRTEERRAASQFIATLTPEQQREEMAQRFDRAATEAAGRAQDVEGVSAQSVATAAQLADAQRQAAIIGRINDPARQGAALARQHMRDAARDPNAPGTVPEPTDASARHRARMEQIERAAEEEARRPENQFDRFRDRGRTR